MITAARFVGFIKLPPHGSSCGVNRANTCLESALAGYLQGTGSYCFARRDSTCQPDWEHRGERDAVTSHGPGAIPQTGDLFVGSSAGT